MVMPRKRKKILIITSIIIVILIIIGILITLYFTTDSFKSNSTLFTKYALQNFENFKSLYDDVGKNEYNNLLKENKYKSKTAIKVNYTENIGTTSENTKNPINELNLEIDGQVDNINNYNYQDIKLKKNNEKISEVKYILDNNLLGIEFSDLFTQYVSANNENLKELLKNANFSNEQLSRVPDKIEFNNDLYSIWTFSQEEIENIKAQYTKIIGNSISKDQFSKKNNQTIEINGKKIKANAHIVTLSKEELNNFFIKILEQLQQDEIILSKIDKLQEFLNQYQMIFGKITNMRNTFNEQIQDLIDEITQNNIGKEVCKITVYESEGVTLKNVIEGVGYEINIDLLSNYMKISYKETESEEKLEKVITLNKDEGQTNIAIQNITEKETSGYNITIDDENDGSNDQKNITIKYQDNVNRVELTIEQTILMLQNLTDTVTLNDENSVKLNDLQPEQMKAILDRVSTGISEKKDELSKIITISDINKVLIASKLMVETQSIEGTGVTATERNRFNSKFEILKGENLNNEQILNLINAVKDNLINLEVISDTQLKLVIDRFEKNDEMATVLSTFIQNNKSKQYNATIEYDDETGFVKDILLTMIEKKK